MFGRPRRRGKHAGAPDAGAVTGDTVIDSVDDTAALAQSPGGSAAGNAAAGAGADRAGPWDEAEAAAAPAMPRVDLGALRVPVVADLEVQLNLLHEELVAVTVTYEDSTLQLQAFAAPKTGGLWDEARQDISRELSGAGDEPTEADGPFGRELRVQLPMQTEYGSVRQPARFVGVDGPRWLLRGVFTGPTGAEPGQGQLLESVFCGTVVVRGEAPMPPREPLPLRMPPTAVDSVGDDGPVGAAAMSPAPVSSYGETET